ncbi:MAG: phosphopantothenate/pantothenate synthetase [Candidatus Lokiarchaeota archaeon]|nr:phosphopantothenate/pantothenate synthetase [Candidatus Lokiarchaeota archaeon]
MKTNNNQDHDVPKDHPRYESLKYRHKIIEGMKKLIVTEAGLIAHGRGECFDYMLGEKTIEIAKEAIKAAIALLYLAKYPVISVNGNTAALCPRKLVELSKIINAPLEINLFYRKEGRIEAIKKVLEDAGAETILGIDETKMVEIEELSSNRRNIDPNGIKIADVVFVPLEDGDRTEALKKIGKKVIAVDLNPISRTSLWADITIVDNIVRTVPEMIKIANKLKNAEEKELKNIINKFDNKNNIQVSLDTIIQYTRRQKKDAFKILKN